MFKTIEIPQHHLSIRQPIGLFISNEFVKSSDGNQIDTFNPATKEKLTSFYAGSETDVNVAVRAARTSYTKTWSKTSPEQRTDLLLKLASLVERDKEILASIETQDSGKPYYTNALLDIDMIIKLTKYFAGSTDKFTTGETIPIDHETLAYTLKVPFGVVAQIVPWNYPLAMASWKLQSCLAAGNTVVIKPSENSSLSLLYFAQLIVEAGFPPGVVNIIPGYGTVVGDALSTHPDVDKISFTGSTKVGCNVLEQSGKSNLKDVTLECGGKSPAVIFKDANLEEAVKWTSEGIFFNSGQNCTANSRILVQHDIFDEFVHKFKDYTKRKWNFGSKFDPFDKDCTVGPVISQKQYEKIQEYMTCPEGCPVEVSHIIDYPPDDINGYFIPPTIYTNVPQDSKWCKEEIFGPAVVISEFRDYDEALSLANDTSYGLAAAVFTENIRIAHEFARDILAGTVWVNTSNADCLLYTSRCV